MMQPTPKEIIDLFDRCLIYIYGQRFAREHPHKSDHAIAAEWLDAGADAFIASVVFFARMSLMHERHLHSKDPGDRTNIPHSLKVFTENIEAAIAKQNGDEVDEWEKSWSQWRSRCKGWKKNPALWQHEHWGPQPFEDGCRVPMSLLKEFA